MNPSFEKIVHDPNLHHHTKAVCVLLDALQFIEDLASPHRPTSRPGYRLTQYYADTRYAIMRVIEDARAATKALNRAYPDWDAVQEFANLMEKRKPS